MAVYSRFYICFSWNEFLCHFFGCCEFFCTSIFNYHSYLPGCFGYKHFASNPGGIIVQRMGIVSDNLSSFAMAIIFLYWFGMEHHLELCYLPFRFFVCMYYCFFGKIQAFKNYGMKRAWSDKCKKTYINYPREFLGPVNTDLNYQQYLNEIHDIN